MSTGILQKGIQLQRNRENDGTECEYGVAGTAEELHIHECCTELLSAYSPKEIYVAAFILPSGNVLERRDDSIHKREAESDMVAGTDSVCTSTGKGTFLDRKSVV